MTTPNIDYTRKNLIGRWYRKDTDEQGQQTVEYAQLAEDGSFEFSFVMLDKQSHIIEQSVELGDWGLVGDIHFTLTKSEVIDQVEYGADLNNPENYHAYKVIQLTHQIFQYQHIVSNEVYTMYKIEGDVAHC